jgi:ABC-type Fe3+ transport system substrate-binding protein
MGLTQNSPHPNAGQLFVEFLLSREGQQISQKANYLPARADVPPTTPRPDPRARRLSGQCDYSGGAQQIVRSPERGIQSVVPVSGASKRFSRYSHAALLTETCAARKTSMTINPGSIVKCERSGLVTSA